MFFAGKTILNIEGVFYLDSIPQQLLLQVLLILLNAFFAATEIAVISLNPAKLRKQYEDGDKKRVVC